MRWNLTEIIIGVLLLTLNGCIGAASVMSIDLGTEFMKVAIVMPGIPMEVVTDSDSKRKTTTTIGFRENERLFASAALKLAIRQPEMVFERVPVLLGKSLDHPVVQRYREWYPYHNMTFDKETGQLNLHHPTGVDYNVEELVGMLIEHARNNAERFIMSDIRTCVITVPPYYGQAERRSMIRAVQLGGLKVLQLMNSNTAVALNFGVFRRSMFNSTPQRFLIFDFGSMSTTATVVSYQVGKHREGGVAGEDPILTILGTASTPNLGTTLLVRRLRDHLARQFMAKKGRTFGGAGDITMDTRAMAKLLAEASNVKIKLSANVEVYAQVENLYEGEDFRMKVLRSEFEELCSDEFNALRKIFDDALSAAQLTMSTIDEIVLMGGGTRIPKVQEQLKILSGRTDLGKGINSDEAAVFGAVYQGTALTPGFRVLRFVVRDYNPYPIAVDFDRAPPASDEGSGEKSDKDVADDSPTTFIRRILFPRANQFPQKRSITFNRHVIDFPFYVNYVELKSDEADYLKATNLSRVETDGVAATFANNSNSEARGVKAHFHMDASGLLNLVRVECLLQTIVKPEEKIETESTLTKLSNTIGGFFGAGKKTDEDPTTAGNASAADAQNGTTPDQPAVNASDEQSAGNHTGNSTLEKTKTEETPKKEEEKVAKKPLKGPVAFSKNVNFKLTHLDIGAPTEKDIQVSMDKLADLRVVELEKREKQKSINGLETVILETRPQLESAEFTRYATESEIVALDKAISAASDWYDEQSHDTPREEYENKLNELNVLLLPINLRVSEGKKRPPALSIFQNALRDSRGWLQEMKQLNEQLERLYSQFVAANVTAAVDNATETSNATEPSPEQNSTGESASNTTTTSDSPPPAGKTTPPPPAWTGLFTAAELTEMEAAIEKIETWFKESKAKLDVTPLTERPPILTEEIVANNQKLASAVLPYYKRLQRWKAEVDKQREAAKAGTAQQPTPPPQPPAVDLGDVKIEEPTDEGVQSKSTDSSTGSEEKTKEGRDEL